MSNGIFKFVQINMKHLLYSLSWNVSTYLCELLSKNEMEIYIFQSMPWLLTQFPYTVLIGKSNFRVSSKMIVPIP